jgi:hypothetical protein
MQNDREPVDQVGRTKTGGAVKEIKDLDELWEKLPELAAKAGYEAGLEHLAAGYPIYYSDDEHPGEIIKHYPDGRREIVRLEDDEEVCVRPLGKASA